MVADEPALGIDDRLAIEDTISSYALGLDADDIDGVVALFTDDAVFETFGREFAGTDRIRRMMESAPKGLHLTGRSLITPNPRGASVTLQLMFVDAATMQSRLACYDETLVKVDGQWRFERIRVRFLASDGSLADRP